MSPIIKHRMCGEWHTDSPPCILTVMPRQWSIAAVVSSTLTESRCKAWSRQDITLSSTVIRKEVSKQQGNRAALEDTVRKNHRVWLEESIPQHYRLCCKESFDRRAGGDIQLRCPKCGTVMQKVLPVTNGHRLGMYICPSCNKE